MDNRALARLPNIPGAKIVAISDIDTNKVKTIAMKNILKIINIKNQQSIMIKMIGRLFVKEMI